MKKNKYRITPNPLLLAILVAMFFTACDSLHLEKRRYNKGMFFDISWRHNGHKKNSIFKKELNSQFTPIVIKSSEIRTEFNTEDFRKKKILIASKIFSDEFISKKHQTLSRPKIMKQKTVSASQTIEVKKHSKHSLRVQGKKSKRRKTSDWIFLAIAGFSGLFSVSLLNIFVQKLRPMAMWAKNNIQKTKAIILGSKSILGIYAWFIGKELASLNILTSDTTTNVLFGMASLAVIFYPSRTSQSRWFKHTYKRQKLFSYLIGFLGFLMVLNIGNQSNQNKRNLFSNAFVNELIEKQNENLNYVKVENKSTPMVVEDGINWEKFWFMFAKVLLTLLSVVIFLLTLYVIAGLSCIIACSGQEAIAVAVFILGWAGAIYLFILVMKSIWSNLKIKYNKYSEKRKLRSA